MPQSYAAFTRGVVQMDHEVAQRFHLEEVIAMRQLDAPTAHGAVIFEREIALVAEVHFKDAGIVLPARCGDRFESAVFDYPTGIVRADGIAVAGLAAVAAPRGGRFGERINARPLRSRVRRQCTSL
jgi:hypothetical protein